MVFEMCGAAVAGAGACSGVGGADVGAGVAVVAGVAAAGVVGDVFVQWTWSVTWWYLEMRASTTDMEAVLTLTVRVAPVSVLHSELPCNRLRGSAEQIGKPPGYFQNHSVFPGMASRHPRIICTRTVNLLFIPGRINNRECKCQWQHTVWCALRTSNVEPSTSDPRSQKPPRDPMEVRI